MDRMITGIKPSGSSITLGNYLGCLKPLISYQDKYELFIFIADLHALTLPIGSEILKENIKNLLKVYLAIGFNINNVCIFKQSSVPAHNQLEWILTCNTQLPELTKMPQYKNFCNTYTGAMPTSILLYPSLMNADILLYDAKFVPVGEDQKPHVDLTRDIAQRFNKVYKNNIFVLPEPILARNSAKIMSLTDPLKKMSKSESDKGTIYILDDETTIKKKIRAAKTDSDNLVYYNKELKPGISNLLNIASCISMKTIDVIEREFSHITNYGVFKDYIVDLLCTELKNLQYNINNITDEQINYILKTGTERANNIASNKIKEVYKIIGLI